MHETQSINNFTGFYVIYVQQGFTSPLLSGGVVYVVKLLSGGVVYVLTPLLLMNYFNNGKIFKNRESSYLIQS